MNIFKRKKKKEETGGFDKRQRTYLKENFKQHKKWYVALLLVLVTSPIWFANAFLEQTAVNIFGEQIEQTVYEAYTRVVNYAEFESFKEFQLSLSAELQVTVQELEEEHGEFLNNFTATSTRLDTVETSITTLTVEKAALETSITTLTAEKAALEAELDTHALSETEARAALQAQIDSINLLMLNLVNEEQLAALETSITTLTAEKAALEAELDTLRADFEAHKTSILATVADLQAQIDTLSLNLSALTGQTVDLSSYSTTAEIQAMIDSATSGVVGGDSLDELVEKSLFPYLITAASMNLGDTNNIGWMISSSPENSITNKEAIAYNSAVIMDIINALKNDIIPRLIAEEAE